MLNPAVAAMKPRLRDDAFWTPVDDGLYVVSARGPATLRGGAAHQWLERLAPFLDGSHTVAELTASLVAERREKVEALLRRLRQLEVVEDASDAAVAKRRRASRTPVLVVGGTPVLPLVRAMLAGGHRQVTVAVPDAGIAAAERLRAAIAAALDADPEQRCELHLLSSDDAAGPARRTLGSLVAAAELVVYAGDRSTDALARALDRLCARHCKPLCHATVRGSEAWLGASLPDAPVTRWVAVQARLDATLHADPIAAALDEAGAALVAGTLARCAGELVAGTHHAANRLTRLDTAGLHTSQHRVVPHPAVPPVRPQTAAGLRAAVAARMRSPAMDTETFSRAAAACVDPYGGLLLELSERDLRQVPLWVVEARACDPEGRLAACGHPGVVHGAALDFVTARNRAARRGLELYAWAVLDRRRLLDGDGAPRARAAKTAPGGRLWGWRPDGHGEHLVSADTVFGPPRRPAGIPVGVASGPTWQDAVQRGLLERCAQAAARAAIAAAPAFPAVDFTAAPLNEAGRRLLQLLRLARARITAHDLSEVLGVPAFLLSLDRQPVAQAAGLTAAEALAGGLEQALLAWQAAAAGQPDYAPAAPAGIPVQLLSDRPRRVPPGLGIPAGADPVSWLAAALSRHGWTPVAVPLDHDPALASVLPHAVRIVAAT
jgi:hypothetical protein